MKKTNFTLFIVCIAAVLFCADSAFAQQGISSEKKKLIKEIRELTGMESLAAKMELSSTNIGDALMPLVERDKELSDEQKQELRKSAFEGKQRLEKQIREFLDDKSYSADLFEDVFFELYDKNFTESELQEMVAFYRTPTGQKSAKFMLKFVDQLSKTFAEAFKQKFQDFANSKLKEEWERLQQKIQKAKKKGLDKQTGQAYYLSQSVDDLI